MPSLGYITSLPPLGISSSVHDAFAQQLNTEPQALPGSTHYQSSAIKSQLAAGNPGGVGAPAGLGISLDTGA